MSTYYGYAEREAEDNINWSTVGNDITKMLKEEVERRETLKSDIDKATREYGETLANAPTGTHKGANDFITRFSDDATQAMLMQDRLLKSGQLKVKDYLLQRANLKDGTKNIFGVAKKFQAEFKRKAERMTKDESAKLEQTLFKMTEGFANFNNSGAYINPTNYSVSLAKKERVQDKDGNYVYQMSKKPQDFFTVSELNTFVSVDLDRFDTEGAMDKIAKAAGARDQSIFYYDKATQTYQTVKISDVTGELFKNLPASQQKLVDNYKKAEEDAIDSIISNPYNAASVLTDYVGKGYDFTFDPSEAAKDDKMILLEKDPSGSGIPKVILSDPQKDEIKKSLSAGIKFRLDQKYEESGVQKRDKSATLIALEQENKLNRQKVENTIKDWVQLVSSASNQGQVNSANQNIIGRYSQVSSKDQNVIRRIVKDEENKQLILYYEPKGGGKLIKDTVSLSDPKSYIRAVKRVLPQQLQDLLTNDQLEKIGLDSWKQVNKKRGFNIFSSNEGISLQTTNPREIPLEIGGEDENYAVKKTVAQAFNDYNESGVKGVSFTTNKQKSERINEVSNKAISKYNEERSLSMGDKLDVNAKVVESGGKLLNVFENDSKTASISVDFYDTKGYSNSIGELTYILIDSKNGKFANEKEFKQALTSFFNDYSNSISNISSFTLEQAMEEKAISFKNSNSLVNTYSINDIINNEDVFDNLVATIKEMDKSNTQTTTQSTTGGGAVKQKAY